MDAATAEQDRIEQVAEQDRIRQVAEEDGVEPAAEEDGVEPAAEEEGEEDGSVTTSLVILADTHVPQRARGLPPEVWAAIDVADVVIHAGDWVDVALLDELGTRAKRLIGVVGNNDGADLRARLPEVARERVAGIRFAVVHETGQATGRQARMDVAYPDTDVLVFGHSHIPWDTVSPAGLRLLNPGSPTDRRRQPVATFMTAIAAEGRLSEVRLQSVDPAWRT